MMDDAFILPLPMHLPLPSSQRSESKDSAADRSTSSATGDDFLDSNLIAGDGPRMMPISRVLIGMLINEFMGWTATLFATLVCPLFVKAQGGIAVFFLVAMVVGLVVLSLCYLAMLECRRSKYPLPFVYFMAVMHGSILMLCVSSALLIHALATLCFVLMVWTGTLVLLLRLVHSPWDLNAVQMSVLSFFSSILVCFVCVAQELTLQDALVNLVAFVLNALLIAFRHDWLSNHASAADTTYSINDTDRAWLDLYTWTFDVRVVQPCRRPSNSATASTAEVSTPLYTTIDAYHDEEL
jgi:hypothetical protein